MMKLRAMLVAREREKKCMMKMHTDGAALYKYLAHIKFLKTLQHFLPQMMKKHVATHRDVHLTMKCRGLLVASEREKKHERDKIAKPHMKPNIISHVTLLSES